MLSPSDTAIVFVLALLLFGPDQLPKLARQLGEAMRHIQNTTHTFMQEMERAADTNDLLKPLDTSDSAGRYSQHEAIPPVPIDYIETEPAESPVTESPVNDDVVRSTADDDTRLDEETRLGGGQAP